MALDMDVPALARSAEALLFNEGGPIERRRLANSLQCKEAELKDALTLLSERLKDGGISLIQTETEVSLVIAKVTSDIVREAIKRDLSRDIGDAGLEVLVIVLYRGPSTRARIDYIRGVNTASTLRTLLSRGLLERVGNPDDAREYLYRPTVELLAHLGVSDVKELPEYTTISAELVQFEQKQHAESEQ